MVKRYRFLLLALPLLTTVTVVAAGSFFVTESDSSSALGGAVTVNTDGSFLYNPTGNNVLGSLLADGREDSFSYTITDGASTGVVTVTLSAEQVATANTPPTAANTSIETHESTPVAIDLRTLVSDAQTSLENLAFQVRQSQNGTAQLLPDGHTAQFVPSAGFSGTAGFRYTVQDDGNPPLFAEARVTVMVHESHSGGGGGPHEIDPEFLGEHQSFLDLVPHTAVTHTAVKSGLWSNSATWENGQQPTTDANVLIPDGIEVTVDTVDPTVLRTVRVDGILSFASNRPTGLTIDFLAVFPQGEIYIGTASNPISRDHPVRILFADRGPIDSTWDPHQLSRGLISHGTTRIIGEYITPYVALATPASAGATTLSLTDTPINWRVGDSLVITGMNPKANEDEERTIASISGNTVTLNQPLSFNHVEGWDGQLHSYVANMERSIVFESQNPDDVGHRGHTMFMHNPDVQIEYAAFNNLGRTLASEKIQDVALDANGQLVPGTGANQRGRYSVHFHRTGTNPHHAPVHVKGVAVHGGKKVGITHHSSNVLIEDTVVYDVVGSGFFTEAGDEIGIWRRNLAIRVPGGHTLGRKGGLQSGNNIHDWGFNGNGFWLQGGGVTLEDNIAVGNNIGIAFFTRGIKEPERGLITFTALDALDPEVAATAKNGGVHIGTVPTRVSGGALVANKLGLSMWHHQDPHDRHTVKSVVEDLVLTNNEKVGLDMHYLSNTIFRNNTLVGNGKTLYGFRQMAGRSGDVDLENMHIVGFTQGANLPGNRLNRVIGGYYDNTVNFRISSESSFSGTRRTEFDAVDFGPASRTDIFLFMRGPAHGRQLEKKHTFGDIFARNPVLVNGEQFFYAGQESTDVPFAEEYRGIAPDAFIGKTNAELFAEFNLALGEAPATTAGFVSNNTDIKIEGGYFGPPVTYQPYVDSRTPRIARSPSSYVAYYENGAYRKEPVTVESGWNFFQRTVNGRSATFIIYGDF